MLSQKFVNLKFVKFPYFVMSNVSTSALCWSGSPQSSHLKFTRPGTGKFLLLAASSWLGEEFFPFLKISSTWLRIFGMQGLDKAG